MIHFGVIHIMDLDILLTQFIPMENGIFFNSRGNFLTGIFCYKKQEIRIYGGLQCQQASQIPACLDNFFKMLKWYILYSFLPPVEMCFLDT